MDIFIKLILVLGTIIGYGKTIYVKQSTISTEPSCISIGEYHYVITDVTEETAPAYVFQSFEGINDPIEASLSGVNGSSAHYVFTIPEGFASHLVTAYTDIYPEWDSNFNLSCLPTSVDIVDFKAQASFNVITFLVISVAFGWSMLALLFFRIKRRG